MKGTLGILVTSERHLEYVISLTETAFKKGKNVKIFFTGRAASLVESGDFNRLKGKANLAVCDFSFRSLGLSYSLSDVEAGLFETQARHADIFKECERYIVF
jgi:hypothetical protein